MVQLQILSGKQAGSLWATRRFPVRVGRAVASDLRLEEDGVWDEHFQITSDPQTGFTLTAQSGALVNVNQAPVQTIQLRNGDLITAGAVKVCFRLGETRQKGLRLREWFVWAMILGVSLGQLGLLAWLLRCCLGPIRCSVPKVPGPGESHGQSPFIRSGDDFRILH